MSYTWNMYEIHFTFCINAQLVFENIAACVFPIVGGLIIFRASHVIKKLNCH